MRIRLIVDCAAATARLYDTATAHDFARLLPVTLVVHDIGGREKAGTLPRAWAVAVGSKATAPGSSVTGHPATTWLSTTTRTDSASPHRESS
jgi:hypothetical protein